MSVWDQIRASLKNNEDPVVHLTTKMLYRYLVPDEPKKKGPPPKKRLNAFSLYSRTPLAGRKTTTTRCWNPYCRNRVTGKYVCDETCKTMATIHLQAALTALHRSEVSGAVEEVPDVTIYDTEGRVARAGQITQREKNRDPRGRKPKGFRKTHETTSDGGSEIIKSLLSEDNDG